MGDTYRAEGRPSADRCRRRNAEAGEATTADDGGETSDRAANSPCRAESSDSLSETPAAQRSGRKWENRENLHSLASPAGLVAGQAAGKDATNQRPITPNTRASYSRTVLVTVVRRRRQSVRIEGGLKCTAKVPNPRHLDLGHPQCLVYKSPRLPYRFLKLRSVTFIA